MEEDLSIHLESTHYWYLKEFFCYDCYDLVGHATFESHSLEHPESNRLLYLSVESDSVTSMEQTVSEGEFIKYFKNKSHLFHLQILIEVKPRSFHYR